MSFILESIKQAERERKLGQQAPSISIEYTGAHVDDIENNNMKWVLLSLALFVTAMVVWSATYYFANKDRQYIEELAFSDVSGQEEPLLGNITAEKTFDKAVSKQSVDIEKRDVLMVPVKNFHKSDLKSVRLISADEEAPKTRIEKAVEVKRPVVNNLASKSVTKNVTRELKSSIAPAVELTIDRVQPKLEASTVSDKQELAEIYSDLSKLAKQESIVNKPKFIEQERFEKNDLQNHVAEKLVQIETASYVVPNVNAVSNVTKHEPISRPVVTSLAPKHAVSTGVPSFGELPYDIQENIPDFNVSVHMFHADPDQRRIRINGNMYTEGKNLQQDLALVEITRYGAVFDYQGHLFRLNVR